MVISYELLDSVNDAEDVGLGEDEVLFAVDFDFGATVFRDEHFVVHLDGEFNELAAVVATASAYGNHKSFLWFFLRAVWENDAASGDSVSFDAFHENALTEWFDVSHSMCCVGLVVCWLDKPS